jgi:hypothetical protein
VIDIHQLEEKQLERLNWECYKEGRLVAVIQMKEDGVMGGI